MTEQTASGIDRAVLSELEEDGPIGHSELCDRIGIQWDDLQESIRRLRNDDKVVLTMDRRYNSTDTGQSDDVGKMEVPSMVDAKKCDRCDEFYTSAGGIRELALYGSGNNPVRPMKDRNKHDLCKTCYQSLQNWYTDDVRTAEAGQDGDLE